MFLARNHKLYAIDGHTRVVLTDLNGKEKEMTFATPIEYILDGMDDYNGGALIQNAFPFLNADELEFILTGLTPTEWEAMFGPDGEEEYEDDEDFEIEDDDEYEEDDE